MKKYCNTHVEFEANEISIESLEKILLHEKLHAYYFFRVADPLSKVAIERKIRLLEHQLQELKNKKSLAFRQERNVPSERAIYPIYTLTIHHQGKELQWPSFIRLQ